MGEPRKSLSSTKFLFFVYFLSWGAYSPYIVRYLSKVGLNGTLIGLLQGLTALLAFLLPPIWGMIADIKKWKMGLLVICLIGMSLGLILYYFSWSFFPLLIATVVYAIFNAPTIPLLDSIALETAESLGSSYGNIRLWGSIGYAVAASIMPYIYNFFENPGSIFLVSLFFISLTLVLISRLPKDTLGVGALTSNSYKNLREGFIILFRNPVFLGLMLVLFICRISVVPYYSYFSLYLEGLNASTFIVGYGWAVAIIGEVIVLYNAERWMKKVGERNFLLLALVLSTIRWIVYGTIKSPGLIFALQWLHGFTFAAIHSVTVKLVNNLAPKGMQVSAQSVYAAVYLGLGGFAGSLIMGYLFDYFGGATAIVGTISSLLTVSGVLSVVALLLALAVVKIKDT